MDARLETYLSEVAASLRPLPAKRRDEELREMRGHLEAAFEAELRRGQSTEEAARGVRAHFGTPNAVGTETVAAWRRGRRLDRRSFWGAMAFALFVPYFLQCLMVLAGSVSSECFRQGADAGPSHDWVFVMVFGLCLVTPFLKGVLVGLLFPRRGIAGMALASCVSGIYLGLQYRHWPFLTLLDVLISVGAAYAVGRWRRRRMERA